MIILTPASCEVAQVNAYERGLRDAARIFAGFELSPEQLAAIARSSSAASQRSSEPLRRGQACRAEADRIAEARSDRTGSLHQVVKLRGGRYGVRRVRTPETRNHGNLLAPSAV